MFSDCSFSYCSVIGCSVCDRRWQPPAMPFLPSLPGSTSLRAGLLSFGSAWWAWLPGRVSVVHFQLCLLLYLQNVNGEGGWVRHQWRNFPKSHTVCGRRVRKDSHERSPGLRGAARDEEEGRADSLSAAQKCSRGIPGGVLSLKAHCLRRYWLRCWGCRNEKK